MEGRYNRRMHMKEPKTQWSWDDMKEPKNPVALDISVRVTANQIWHLCLGVDMMCIDVDNSLCCHD